MRKIINKIKELEKKLPVETLVRWLIRRYLEGYHLHKDPVRVKQAEGGNE